MQIRALFPEAQFLFCVNFCRNWTVSWRSDYKWQWWLCVLSPVFLRKICSCNDCTVYRWDQEHFYVVFQTLSECSVPEGTKLIAPESFGGNAPAWLWLLISNYNFSSVSYQVLSQRNEHSIDFFFFKAFFIKMCQDKCLRKPKCVINICFLVKLAI